MPDTRRPSWAARMADARRRARLTPAETRAAVALAEATVGGLVENARPFAKGGQTFFRIEVVVPADDVEALLDALAESDGLAVR